MKRILFSATLALFFFILLDFVYFNLDAATFGYQVSFKFSIPHVVDLVSAPLPMGFVLLLAFCSGMIVVSLLEALPSFYKSLELYSKNKKIRQLERELQMARQMIEEKKLTEEVPPL